ncbi:hypothetical protein ES703_31876 [subsurface metagenome]
MVKIINIFGDVYSGQAGKAGVFAKWKGRQYRRKYVIPANPQTTMQMTVRGYFTNAIATWHTYHSIQRLVYSYLATGLVMSGFNLLVRRWQLAATKALDLPIAPQEGIKQICSAQASTPDDTYAADNRLLMLGRKPVKIGSAIFTEGTSAVAQAAYVDREMGDVRIPVAITQVEDGAATLVSVAEGDQLVISYTSGGRTVTREILYTVGASGSEIPAKATIALALRTKYYPIDFESVVVETFEATLEHYEQIESMEIDNILGKTYLDLSMTGDADSVVSYTSYTAIETAKLEVTKVDTSFITWRRYSDEDGLIYVAQTVEDETYDWTLSAALKVSLIRAAQSAVLSTRHELIQMEAAA